MWKKQVCWNLRIKSFQLQHVITVEYIDAEGPTLPSLRWHRFLFRSLSLYRIPFVVAFCQVLKIIVHDVHVFALVEVHRKYFQYIPRGLGSCTTNMLQVRVPKKTTTKQPNNGEFFNIQLPSTENPQLILRQLCASTTPSKMVQDVKINTMDVAATTVETEGHNGILIVCCLGKSVAIFGLPHANRDMEPLPYKVWFFIRTSKLRYTGVPLYLKKHDVHLPFHHLKLN